MKKIFGYIFVFALLCCSSVLFFACNKQYSITIAQTQNGTIYANREKAQPGDKIELTVLPDSGYVLEQGSLKVNGTAIENFEFEMPNTDVTISSTFVLENGGNFSVNYHTNQWTTHSNPLSVTAESQITLIDATRPGYHFDGWYSDENFTNKVTTIDQGTTANINLYPKFKQIFVTSVGTTYASITDLTTYGMMLETLYVPSNIDGFAIKTFAIQKPCQNVKTLTIENGVQSIVAYLTLWGSEKLETVNLPKSIDISPFNSPLFKNCTSLTTINLDSENTNIYQKDGVIYKFTSGTHYQTGYYEHIYLCCYPNGRTNTTFVIPEEVTHLNDFGKAKFSSVVISKNVTAGQSSNPFAECENLTQISVDKDNTHYVAYQNRLYQITDNASTLKKTTLVFSADSTTALDFTQNFVVDGKEFCVTDIFETALNQTKNIEKIIVNFVLIDIDIFENMQNIKMLSTKPKPEPANWTEQDKYADVLGCNNIYWYSEIAPSTTGNYWHYDNQNNAVLWN